MASTCPILLVLFCVYATINAQFTLECQEFINQNAFFEEIYPADTYCWTCKRPQNNRDVCGTYNGGRNRPSGINLRFQIDKGKSVAALGLALVKPSSLCDDGKPMYVCSASYVCAASGITYSDVHNANVFATNECIKTYTH